MAGQLPFLPPDFAPQSHMVLLEGETDTMATWQAAPDEAKPGIVGLSGLNAWKDRYAEELFGEAKVVWIVFDNDDPYTDAGEQNAKAKAQIRKALGRKAKVVKLPQGPQDVAEFFQLYDWGAFRVLLKAAMEPKRHYARLDLTKPVPPTDWLVEDLLVSSEATVIAADSGVGKSFIMQALSLAVAGGEEHFLGLKLQKHGRVLYVDEENSAQLAMQRLAALSKGMFGTTEIPDVVRDNLEYIWYAGVDLANEPEKLLEEAIDLEPELVILDSLSRTALGVDENSNTDMSALFRRALVPLARDTGAAVVVIHHTPTDNAGKPRGATAIKAAADQSISITAATNRKGDPTGVLNIFPSKPRRLTALLQAKIVGDVEKEGWARVETAEEDAPF